MNQKAQVPKTFTTIDGNSLMAQQFAPLKFSVEKILPHGLFILAGSPKIGKSWLALELCQAVTTGGGLWEFPAKKGTALYLALEDNHSRLQGRLSKFEIGAQDISRLHMATSSFGIHNGLLEQMHNFLTAHPETRLIVVDTLEHIRNGDMDKSIYSYDYQDMTKLREITSKHNVTLLLVHHTRKTRDSDPLNKISGSTGLVGAVDGAFVLEQIRRIENGAYLTIANRDTETYCLKLLFDKETCRWKFLGYETEAEEEGNDILLILLDDFLKGEWRGTSTELCGELKKLNDSFDLTPATLTKRLKALVGFSNIVFRIAIDFERTHKNKLILLKRIEP
jgi:hypothetical protein